MRFDEKSGLVNYRVFDSQSKDFAVGTIADIDIEYRHGVPFLLGQGKDSRKQLLLLHSQYFVMAFWPGRTSWFFGATDAVRIQGVVTGGPEGYTASSELAEDSSVYSASNLRKPNPSTPWCEGVSGPGSGETIAVSWRSGKGVEYRGNIRSLIIGNGFVSYEKPYLYTANARAETLRITNEARTFETRYVLEDSPSPQIVELPEPTDNVRIEILKTFPGERWDDLCVNFIWGMDQAKPNTLKE
jgi:hypothetical protein